MKVTEMKRFPRQAGVAVLRWFPENDRLPSRNGKVIRLPKKRTDADFYPLKGGEQFLFKLGNFDLNEPGMFDYIHFGGTDEVPFLASLKPQALLSYLNGGEHAFFEVLKPSIIQRLELIWGKNKTQRQGDIFAYPMPYDWDELFKRWQSNITGNSFGITREYISGLCDDSDGTALFDTRHKLSGEIYEGEFWLDGVGRFCADNSRPLTDERCPIVLGEGTVEAEDHKELALKGLHLIAQAALHINRAEVE